MTVKQLIKKLESLPSNSLVILQKDGEGNGYSPLSGLGTAVYRPDSTWSGERVDGEDYEREPGDVAAVVLCPVN